MEQKAQKYTKKYIASDNTSQYGKWTIFKNQMKANGCFSHNACKNKLLNQKCKCLKRNIQTKRRELQYVLLEKKIQL